MSVSEKQPFDLVTNYQPAGDQPQAIEKLVAGIEKGYHDQLLLGVTGSGKTYTMANVIARTQRPTIVMAHNKTLAAQLYGEFKSFFPNNAVEYFVSYYDYYQPEAYVPSSDTFIEKDSAINDHIDQMRLSATRSLLERRDAIIVASVSAIYGLGDPNAYMSMLLHIVQGAIVSHVMTSFVVWWKCNIAVMSLSFYAVPIVSAVKLLIFSLPNRTSTQFGLSCLMMKSIRFVGLIH